MVLTLTESVMILGGMGRERGYGKGEGETSFQPLTYLIITASVGLRAFLGERNEKQWRGPSLPQTMIH